MENPTELAMVVYNKAGEAILTSCGSYIAELVAKDLWDLTCRKYGRPGIHIKGCIMTRTSCQTLAWTFEEELGVGL